MIDYWKEIRAPDISNDPDILRNATYMLYARIVRSYMDDIIKAYSVHQYDLNPDLQHINVIWQWMHDLVFYLPNQKKIIYYIKEGLYMAAKKNQRARKKAEASKKQSFKMTGDNENEMSIIIYGSPSKRGSYQSYFSLLNINGIQISGSLMLATKKGDNSFFSYPSYYSESKDEYITQVSIKDEGIKEDIDQFISFLEDKVDDSEDAEDIPFAE